MTSNDTKETSNDDEVAERERIEVLAQLAGVKNDAPRFARLAPIEQMILIDILDNANPLSCANCLRWARALIEKSNQTGIPA